MERNSPRRTSPLIPFFAFDTPPTPPTPPGPTYHLSMSSFASLGLAQEQQLVRAQTAAYLKTRLEAMVASGAVDAAAALQALSTGRASSVPTRVVKTRPEWVYKHVKSAVPCEFLVGKGVGETATASGSAAPRRPSISQPPPLTLTLSPPSILSPPPPHLRRRRLAAGVQGLHGPGQVGGAGRAR